MACRSIFVIALSATLGAQIDVRVADAELRDVAHVEKLGGWVVADSIDLSAPMSGEVIGLEVRAGDILGHGDAVAAIDPRRAELAVRIAEAAVREHKARYDQALARHRRSQIDYELATVDLDRHSSGLDLAKNRITAAENDLDRAQKQREAAIASAAVVDRAKLALGEARAELDRVNARVETAARTAKRARVEAGMAQAEIEIATAGVQRAEAELQRARLDLESTRIRCPFENCLVDVVHVSPGELARGGETVVVSIIALDSRRVRLDVRAAKARHLRVGQPAEIVPGTGSEPTIGRVTRIRRRIDQGLVRVEVEAGELDAFVGEHCKTSVLVSESVRALVIPPAAIHDGPQPSVWILRGGRATRRIVEVGLRDADGGWVQIVDGLSEGDAVVIEPSQGMREGARVNVVR